MAAPGSILYTEAVILDGRTVLIGSDSAYDFSVETEVLSTDGASWTAGVAPSMAKVAAAPGIVAAGVDCVDVCPDDLPVTVSRSTDGLVWTEDPLDPALAQARADVVGTWRGRAVLGGSAAGEGAEGSGPAVWLDEPGGWRRSPLEDAASGTVEAVLDAGETLLVMTRQDADAPAEAWTTVDGRVWEAVPVDGVFHGYVVAHAGRGPIVAIVDYDTIWASLP